MIKIALGKILYKKNHLPAILLPAISLFIACAITSFKKPFWYDEILSYYLVADKSLLHMLTSLGKGVDQGFPLYYIFAWIWGHVFGKSEISLRLFSSILMGMACAIIYYVLSKIYKFWPTFIGVIAVFCGSELIFYQNSEARFYGLLCVISALCICLYYKACLINKISSRILLLTALAHGGLVLTHIFGFVYSSIILISLIIRDRHFRIFRPSLYVAVLSGWLLFLPWLQGAINQLDLVKYDFWLAKPQLNELLVLYRFYSSTFFLSLLAFGILMIVFSSGLRKYAAHRTCSQNYLDVDTSNIETSLCFLMCILFVLPTIIWIISRFSRPFFLDRYFIPVLLAWPFFIASSLFRYMHEDHEYNEIEKRNLSFRLRNCVLISISAIFLFYPIKKAQITPSIQFSSLSLNTIKKKYPNVPIVSAGNYRSAVLLLPHIYYAGGEGGRYFYLLDNISLESSSFYMDRMMEALDKYYLHGNVISSQEFLRSHSLFLVLNSHYWFDKRIKHNPAYQHTILSDELILVQKK